MGLCPPPTMTQTTQAPLVPPTPRPPPDPSPFILGGFAIFICLWFRLYFTSEPIAAVDLPGHITAIEGLRDNLNWWKGSPAFYDVSCFTGYPAFQFYAFLAHLLCAILSVPLMWFSDEPARLCAHLMLVAALATLPISMMRAARPFAREIFKDMPELEDKYRWVLALCTCTLAFWFINHDYQWYGIGAGAVLNIGLFSQAFAWHLMMLHFGYLVEFIQEGGRKNRDKVAISFALLFMTHTMTAVFNAFMVLLSFLWYRDRRKDLLAAHGLAFALCGFWVLPMVIYMGGYTPLDIHRPTGDFMEIFLRYPYYAMFRSLASWLHGYFEPLNPTEMAVTALLVVLVASKHSRKCPTLITYFVFAALGLAVMTSGFMATSVRFGFHWYRFVAYLFFFLVQLLTVVPLIILRTAHDVKTDRPIPDFAKFLVAGAALGCLVVTALLPHNERDRITRSRTPSFLQNERAVLDHFKQLPVKGRVITEYFSNYDKFPFLSCHFISTHMLRDTGFEPINGLFVQGSFSYHMPMGAANQLKANSYNCPLLYPAITDLTDDDKVRQLREYNITHVIGITGSDFTQRLQKHAEGEAKVIGPYTIMQILPEPAPMVRPIAKRVAVYVDLRGTLPYKFVSLVFYGKQKLSTTFELLELKKGDTPPPQTEVLVINGKPSDVQAQADVMTRGFPKPVKVVSLDYRQHYTTRHYSVQYQHNHELDDFTDASTYLDKKFNIAKELGEVPAPETPDPERNPVTMAWDRDRQGFTVQGLEPGRMYRINYSYFPYWRSGDGQVFRGGQERIFFIADKSRARFTWAPYASPWVWFGWASTLLGAWYLWRAWRREKNVPPPPVEAPQAPESPAPAAVA
jgi:hypothetical protein